MKLEQAREIAKKWVEVLRPSCERVEIAGSVRREKPEVHDIEIVAIPKLIADVDMFGTVRGNFSALNGVLDIMEGEGSFQMLKNGPKFKQLALPEQINIDLFLVTPPAQFGVIYLIRTGPAEFNRWMVTPREIGGALPGPNLVKDGCVWHRNETADNWEPLPMPEEADYFTLCGMEYIEPKDRQPQWGRMPLHLENQ